MVHAWDDAGVVDEARRMKAFAFDLDNTLASSKRPMSQAMTDRFVELTRRTMVAVVTGGRYELVVSQVLDAVGERADRSHLHLMPTGGSRYYRWRGRAVEDAAADAGEWECVYAHDLSATDRLAATASLEARARELGLWEEHIWGERIEDRGSQLTFSALGQEAPEEAKRSWDPDETKKRALVAAVSRDLPHLKVRAGGYTSIDVSLPGMDKSFAVHELARILSVPVSSIAFVGDRMTPGGNDYPAAEAGAYAIAVTSPADTLRFLDRLLDGPFDGIS
ncbi:HAD-IIB family hydrolase [Bifidobacterium aerophilum]|uniref:phosphomannomutase n=1 Tax=Bifidobacterium aerophilum TaxID=1798155 RepID=A0A6N9Z4K0_9BIFI|nr:HAD-IIB family hydrolase [Bifidobacterium aerophilum]NEG89376.1 HAD-IIB family hydrolase [Bifidobacterium aerophilum]